MKNYQSSPTGSILFLEMNATSSNNFERGQGRGRGYGCSQGRRNFQIHHGPKNRYNYKTISIWHQDRGAI